ncbi:hypothetical protein ETTORE_0002 [Pseudomonas phage Ettore]|nr:hypothetical protein ETTORE_0002 [Pseudomonas phage Ettore]
MIVCLCLSYFKLNIIKLDLDLMKLFEVFTLYEDKAELIVKNQGPKLLTAAKNYGSNIRTAEEIMNVLKSADPTSDQKYLQWITNRFIAGEFRLEDTNRIRADLISFERYKRVLPKKDINQYKTLGELYAVIDPLNDAATGNDLIGVSNKQVKKHAYNAKRQELISSGQADVIYKGQEGMLVNPKTEDAAIFFGQGTRWCTAATSSDNMFSHYHSQGPLYTWLGSDGFKAQFHLETNQWMDSKDEPLDNDQMSKLLSIPIIKKLYDDGIIKSEKSLVGDRGGFDDEYDNRLSDDYYFDMWADRKYRIKRHIEKHGMSEYLIDTLSVKDPLLPLFVLPEYSKYPASKSLDDYFLKLSKLEPLDQYKEINGYFESDMLLRLTRYLEDSTGSHSKSLDDAGFNFVRRLLDIGGKDFDLIISNYLKHVAENSKTKQYLLSNLPLAVEIANSIEWPELMTAIEHELSNAKTPKEENDAIKLGSELMFKSNSLPVSKWFINLLKTTDAGKRYLSSLPEYDNTKQ